MCPKETRKNQKRRLQNFSYSTVRNTGLEVFLDNRFDSNSGYLDINTFLVMGTGHWGSQRISLTHSFILPDYRIVRTLDGLSTELQLRWSRPARLTK